MFKPKSVELIRRAQSKATKAVSVFKQTMDELKGANDELNEVIEEENNKIKDAEEIIYTAHCAIEENNNIIHNLNKLTF